MTKQQSKRRRKRYQPGGSAYAGDVKPGGVFSLLGDVRLIRVVFVVMALALVAGLFGAAFGFGFGSTTRSKPSFVLPDDRQTTATPAGTPEELRQYTSAPAMTIDPDKTYVATISTPLGDIEVELLPGETPQTVNNFVFLARDGFYDGLTFHQVAEDFDAQAGDPSCEVGSTTCRGQGGPGYDLPQEAPGPFETGEVGMANGSQFFIALTDSSQFAQFTPFGRVTSGLDVAQQLTQGTAIEKITIQES